jgi:hypothetical protein
MEDICIVCAEPLQFTAYGGCSHKDACSKCVSRLRSVLKDPRCLYCQVPADAVVVTRFMGGYTETVPSDEFETLPVGVGVLLGLGALCGRSSQGLPGGWRVGSVGWLVSLVCCVLRRVPTPPVLAACWVLPAWLLACRVVPSGGSFTTSLQPRHILMTWRTSGR